VPKIHIPERFGREIDQHLVMNLAGIDEWPLVLGIFGRPGDGKSFQARTHAAQCGAFVVSINAADLESDRAGQPGKMVLAKYIEAGKRAEQGQPAVLLVDDFDTTVGEWSNSTSTVNHQQVLAQIMHLADSPTETAEGGVRRVPVIVTGNDLSKIYPPLRRPGRMRVFTWEPTAVERATTVQTLLDGLVNDADVVSLLDRCPDAPVAFFADLRTAVLADRASDKIAKLASHLATLVKDPEAAKRDLTSHMTARRGGNGAIVELAQSEWARRQAAEISHLEDR